MRPVREVPLKVFREVDLEVGIGVARQDERRKLVPFGLEAGDNLSFDVYRGERTFLSVPRVGVVHGDSTATGMESFPYALVQGRASLIPPVGTYQYRLVLRRGDKKHLLAHGPFTVAE